MKVYERYLAREIYLGTTLVLLAFLLLFGFFDLVHELEDVGKNGYGLPHALGFVLLTLPGRVYELFPVAVLIGSLYALTLLARHSEIIILRASGLSTRRLLVTLSKLGLGFVVLVFLVGEFLAPPAENLARQLQLKTRSPVVGQEFRSGVWVKDERNFVNVRDMRPDGRLHDVRIFAFDERYQLQSISEAREARYVTAGDWQLEQVMQTSFANDRTEVRQFPSLSWKSALTPDILSVLMVVPERMSFVQLWQYIRHLEGNQQKAQRYQIALWKKLIYPLAVLVMMVLALPFAYLQDRMGGVSIKIFAGVMLGIAFHMLNGLFSSLGAINNWPPFWSAITPGAIFLLAAAGLLWWSERR
ncbi:MAG: LPS export ABC transporter permease LptG [Sterolibacterium sp.]|nr:LPS export ABC transporter permease LptG [Sterolibacterium sp.]